MANNPILDDPEDFPDGYYWYVQRWYDDHGVQHYHGVRSKYNNIHDAQKHMKFNLLASPVDLVYGPCNNVIELSGYLSDVNNCVDGGDSDIGTLRWKSV